MVNLNELGQMVNMADMEHTNSTQPKVPLEGGVTEVDVKPKINDHIDPEDTDKGQGKKAANKANKEIGVKEDHITELSQAVVQNYMQRARENKEKAWVDKNKQVIIKRQNGMKTAYKKLTKEETMELFTEKELAHFKEIMGDDTILEELATIEGYGELDELSQKTVVSYLDKANAHRRELIKKARVSATEEVEEKVIVNPIDMYSAAITAMVAEGNWIPKHMVKGGLHRMLGVPEGQKIPKSKIAKAEHSKDPLLRHRAIAAHNMEEDEKELDQALNFDEDYVQLNELSKAVVRRYIRKASSDPKRAGNVDKAIAKRDGTVGAKVAAEETIDEGLVTASMTHDRIADYHRGQAEKSTGEGKIQHMHAAVMHDIAAHGHDNKVEAATKLSALAHLASERTPPEIIAPNQTK